MPTAVAADRADFAVAAEVLPALTARLRQAIEETAGTVLPDLPAVAAHTAVLKRAVDGLEGVLEQVAALVRVHATNPLLRVHPAGGDHAEALAEAGYVADRLYGADQGAHWALVMLSGRLDEASRILNRLHLADSPDPAPYMPYEPDTPIVVGYDRLPGIVQARRPKSWPGLPFDRRQFEYDVLLDDGRQLTVPAVDVDAETPAGP
jgi:hypothetical protein